MGGRALGAPPLDPPMKRDKRVMISKKHIPQVVGKCQKKILSFCELLVSVTFQTDNNGVCINNQHVKNTNIQLYNICHWSKERNRNMNLC